jgi:hypothetical protein
LASPGGVLPRWRALCGIVGVDWKLAGNRLTFKATIPANSRAEISIPKAGLRNVTVEENGRVLGQKGAYRGGVPGITAATDEPEYVTFHTGSGVYSFILREGN